MPFLQKLVTTSMIICLLFFPSACALNQGIEKCGSLKDFNNAAGISLAYQISTQDVTTQMSSSGIEYSTFSAADVNFRKPIRNTEYHYTEVMIVSSNMTTRNIGSLSEASITYHYFYFKSGIFSYYECDKGVTHF